MFRDRKSFGFLCVLACASCAPLGASTATSSATPTTTTTSASRPSGVAAYGQPGPMTVQTIDLDWHDQARDRDVPARIYYPKSPAGPCPVIIFSHGAGGSREGYGFLGRHWASHGYVSVHLTHLGSDGSALRPGGLDRLSQLREMVADPQNAINRPRDVSFAIDQLAKLNKEDKVFKGLLDLDRVGVAGHSFGACTTLASAGQVFTGPLGRLTTLGDSRLKAAIAMSAPLAKGDSAALDKTYGPIKLPCLHMTGTEDVSLISSTAAADRRKPFDHMSAADNYLLTLAGGDHMIFAGNVRLTSAQRDREDQRLILISSTLFWDAYLRGDSSAKALLADGAFEKALGENGQFEKKPKAAPAATTTSASRPAAQQ